MRLHEIKVENFGMLRGREIRFGDGRFHLVCGPNEAGKTTLLQLIRELLFGFAVQNPYAFPEHDGEIAATALAEMKDGTRIRFRRRKGRTKVVTGEVEGTGRTFDESGLVGLLGNANAEMYQNVFGFSLAELAAGEESLKHARLEEALYGGGLGGLANFQRTLAAIQEEHNSLFMTSRRAQRPQINRLLGNIHDVTTQLGQATIKPRDYKEMCQRRDERVAAAAKLKGDRDECFRRQAHVERLVQALPSWQRLAQAEQELAAVDVPEAFPLAAAEEFRQLRHQVGPVAVEVAAVKTELDETAAELRRIQLSPELVAAEVDVKRLFQQLEQVASCRRDVPLRTYDADTSRNQVSAVLQDLHPDWDLQYLKASRSTLERRDRVEQMAKESADLQKRGDAAAIQYKAKEAKLKSDRRELERLRAVPSVPQLENLTQRAGKYRADREQLEQLDNQLTLLDGEIAQLRRQIVGSLGITPDQVELLPVPLMPAVQQFARDFSEATNALRQAERERKQAEQELARIRNDLSQFDAQQHVPDRSALTGQRARRDDGWHLIRRTYIEGQSLEEEVTVWLGEMAASLPDQYEHEVAEADRLADDRQEKAELVARRDGIIAEVARLEQRLAEAQQQKDDCQAARDRLDEAWRELWAACRLSPQSPETMADWLRLHGQLCQKLQDRLGVSSRRQQVQRRLSGFEMELRQAIGSEDQPDDLLAEAERRAQEARDSALQIARLERDLPAEEEALDQLRDEQEDLVGQQELWRGQWQKLLGEIGFPLQWDFRLVTKVLSELANAQLRYQAILDLEGRITEMTETVASFGKRVSELCGRLAPDLEALPPEEATAQLNQRLEEAKQAVKEHKSLLAQRDRAEQRSKAKQQQQEQLATRLAGLRKAAGVASDDDFERLAIAAASRKTLADEVAGLRREVLRIAANEEPEGFRAELAQADADALVLAARQAKEDLDAAEEGYRKAVEEEALAKKQVEDLDGQDRAGELVQKLESGRAELRDSVERWAPLVLADAILAQAIARFEREHQPAMLRDVGQLFSRLTHGRYVGLHRRLDEQGTLLLAEATGKDKEPGQLSGGTREQLYLAIRLAYARHYCRENEPLPLVMDDVLVNFDDERSDAALDVLIELGQDIQVVFLTCHEDTIRRIRSRLPGMEPTQLV